MKTKTIYLKIAGFLNVFTAFLHTIGGQMDLINPFLKLGLNTQIKAELLGVWHMVTIFLFSTSYILLLAGFKQKKHFQLIQFIGFLFILMSIPFIINSIVYQILVPQWILLLPIGILTLIGINKTNQHA